MFSTELPIENLAYLDAGTGSMIIQAIVGVFAVIATGFTVFWSKVRRIFSRFSKKTEQKVDSQEVSSE